VEIKYIGIRIRGANRYIITSFTYLSTKVSRLPSVSNTSLSIFADVGNLKEGDAEPLDGTILMLGSGMIVFCVSA